MYRRAIDDAVAGKPSDPTLLTTLEGLAHRAVILKVFYVAIPMMPTKPMNTAIRYQIHNSL